MSGTAVYPGATYCHTGAARLTPLTDVKFNAVGDEIQTIEENLGVNPGTSAARAATYGTVDARFEADEALVNALLAELFKGVIIANTIATPTTKLDVAWALIGMTDSAGVVFTRATFSATLDTAAVGANGKDTATALAINTWYRVWGIYNPNTATSATLISPEASGNSPTMPSGYTAKRQIGAWRVDSSTTLAKMCQVNRRCTYHGDEGNGNLRVLGLGRSATMANVACSSAVPPGVRSIIVNVLVAPTGGTGNCFLLNGGAVAGAGQNGKRLTPDVAAGGEIRNFGIPIMTDGGANQNIQYKNTGTNTGQGAYIEVDSFDLTFV